MRRLANSYEKMGNLFRQINVSEFCGEMKRQRICLNCPEGRIRLFFVAKR